MKSMMLIFAALFILSFFCFGAEYEDLDRQVAKRLSTFANAPSREAYKAINDLSTKMIEMDDLDPRGYRYLIILNRSSSERLFPQSTAVLRQSQIINKYAVSIWDGISLFQASPTKKDFNKLELSIEQLISMNELSSVGYKQFAKLYDVASGVFMDESERLDRTIQLIDRYQSTEGREDDLSDLLKFYSSRRSHREKATRLQKKQN
jgi:hypothetical protein